MEHKTTHQDPDYSIARANMVDGQLRPNGITDPVILRAMGDIPRELFVPSGLVGAAYSDADIRLLADRHLLRPLTLAKLIQAARIMPTDKVLELAPATGYSTLVLASLTSKVVSVEPDALLCKELEKNVLEHAPGRVEVLAGAPIEVCISRAPFDVIFINGRVEMLPERIFDQLSENGRLITVLSGAESKQAPDFGKAVLCKKSGEHIEITTLFETHAPLAPGFLADAGFEFK